MDSWDEVRTAYQVAHVGTVSGAADALGVHHATVIRHIDSLEARLGVKLFQRHARGYTPTEAGEDLLKVARVADDQFEQLEGRIKGQGAGVSGELVITSLDGLAPLFLPILTSFQNAHPDVVVKYLTGERLFRLEYGEAHVAIRAGSAPEQLDNVVQSFHKLRYGMYAARSYVAQHGKPETPEAFKSHRFIGRVPEESRAPFFVWLRETLSDDVIRFRGSDAATEDMAIRAGAGIGFLPERLAAADPDLVEILPSRPDWDAPLWLVTHVDLHRTAKVQAFLSHVKAETRSWDD